MADNIAIQNLLQLAANSPNSVVLMGNLQSLFREILSQTSGDLRRDGTVTGATSQAQEFVNGISTTGVVNSVIVNENNIYISDGVNSVQLLPTGVIKVNGTDVTPTIAALTKTDDTNVTLTLGGTPASALLKAVSLTLGWTGTLSAARGGTAQSTYATGDTLYASAANTISKLSGNTSATLKVMTQTGNGVTSAATVWTTPTLSLVGLANGQYPGTTTNDTATAGNIGEEVIGTSVVSAYGATATYEAATSIALTAGDWAISAFFTYEANGATITAADNAIFLIGASSASDSGVTEGLDIAYIPQASLLGTSKMSGSIAPYSLRLSGTTTYYLNTQATFTVGAPKYTATLRAVRIR